MNTAWFYVIVGFASAIGFMAAGHWVNKKYLKHHSFGVQMLSFIGISALGMLFMVLGPLHHARVVSDTALFARAPFKTAEFRQRDDGTVYLAITNAVGEYMFLDIDTNTRRVGFSRVDVPKEIQF